jgi:hypothetical protein
MFYKGFSSVFQVARSPGGTTSSARHPGRSIARAGYDVDRQSKLAGPGRVAKASTVAVHLTSIFAVFHHVAGSSIGERRG